MKLHFNLLLLVIMFLPFTTKAQQFETEPNNTDDMANPITIGVNMIGAMGASCGAGVDDSEDRFKLVLTNDCTIKITTAANNPTAATHNLNVDVIKGGAIQFSSNRISGNNGVDSIITNTHYCLSKGTYIIRLTRAFNTCYHYSLLITVVNPVYAADTEPNNNFDQADAVGVLSPNSYTQGHINFSYGDDADDRYKIVLNEDGRILINIDAERDGPFAGSMIVNLYKNGAPQWNMNPDIGAQGIPVNTNGIVECLNAGVYDIGVNANFGCGVSYRLKYELIQPVFTNDVEPNNNFSEADANGVLPPDTWTQGHINFKFYPYSPTDADDRFRFSVAANGDITFVLRAEKWSDGTGNLYITLFNSGGGVVSVHDVAVGGNQIPIETPITFADLSAGEYIMQVTSFYGCGISYCIICNDANSDNLCDNLSQIVSNEKLIGKDLIIYPSLDYKDRW